MRTPSMGYALLFTLTLGFTVGCASSGAPERQPAAGQSPEPSGRAAPVVEAGLIAPVTYTGRLPCADCLGIQLTVTLFPDSTFRLRQVYRERPAVFYNLGRWSVEEDGTRLVLRSGAETPQRFEIGSADSLRMLDSLGQPIQSSLNYGLVRVAQVDPVRDTMRLRGTYTYMADAGRFTECLSGSAFPVAQVGDNAALERAYTAERHEPGAPLLVGFTGHFEDRPAMEGDRRMEHVVVDHFDRVLPGATCEERMRGATLENTDWKLLELGGQPARVAGSITEPNLLLDPAQKQARGSTGCNSFGGSYELRGSSLRFGPLVSTQRACLDPVMSAQENAFLKALGETRTWQVTGDTLVLAAEAGPVARFAAQHMK